MKKTIHILTAAVIVLALAVAGLATLCFGRQGSTTVRNDTTDMVFVEGGTFTMGTDEDLGYKYESPAHEVTVDDFYIGRYEVTLAEFAAFVDDTGYVTLAERDTLPVSLHDGSRASKYYGLGSYVTDASNASAIREDATWRCDSFGDVIPLEQYSVIPVVHLALSDAEAYCHWLAYKSGKPYRLPTEAEWEFAAQGGRRSNHTLYSGSDNIDEVAWYRSNSGRQVHPVGTKKPNELGLYDMSGNVGEWVAGEYRDYTPDAQVNPFYCSTDFIRESIARGGSFWRFASYCRNSNRLKIFSVSRGGGVGFRVAYSPSKK